MTEAPLAAILPFRDEGMRAPIDLARRHRAERPREAVAVPAGGNVVLLAEFARSGRRRRRFVLSPPPDGEAA